MPIIPATREDRRIKVKPAQTKVSKTLSEKTSQVEWTMLWSQLLGRQRWEDHSPRLTWQ
jgi:hypothetical protein